MIKNWFSTGLIFFESTLIKWMAASFWVLIWMKPLCFFKKPRSVRWCIHRVTSSVLVANENSRHTKGSIAPDSSVIVVTGIGFFLLIKRLIMRAGVAMTWMELFLYQGSIGAALGSIEI